MGTSKQFNTLLIILILGIAVFFRFYKLDSAPPGLFRDEAMNGNNAIEALATGDFKVFYPENNGREGLFINLQALSLDIFGAKVWALRIVSAIAGTLTVLGIYFLARTLFNEQIGLMSAFLLATSFWHVNFSRIGFRAILAPFFLVWGLYFLWQGLATTRHSQFILSGLLLGLGLHTYIAFRIVPLAILLALLAYWHFIKKDFKLNDPARYGHLRKNLLRGIAIMVITAGIVFAPLAYHFYQLPQDFLGRTSEISIFSGELSGALKQLLINSIQTLAMFNFRGDHNWRHNIASDPMLIWPVGIFFVVGIFHSIVKIRKIRAQHGHFSTTYTLLLSMFIVGLIPTIISNEGMPHALRSILIIPATYIFAAGGMVWFFNKLKEWYSLRDAHPSEARMVVGFVFLVFLLSIAIVEYDRYFKKWAQNPSVASEFNSENLEVGRRLNAMPLEIKKYVLVKETGGVLVNGIGLPAQTTMFVTDTYTPEKQKAKNIYYLTAEQYANDQYDRNSVIIPLN